MLVIPAATARLFSYAPHQMAIYASILGVLTVIFGIILSVFYDTPPAPMIVVVAGIIFIATSIGKLIQSKLLYK